MISGTGSVVTLALISLAFHLYGCLNYWGAVNNRRLNRQEAGLSSDITYPRIIILCTLLQGVLFGTIFLIVPSLSPVLLVLDALVIIFIMALAFTARKEKEIAVGFFSLAIPRFHGICIYAATMTRKPFRSFLVVLLIFAFVRLFVWAITPKTNKNKKRLFALLDLIRKEEV